MNLTEQSKEDITDMIIDSRDIEEDRVYAHKFAIMQKQINEKVERIKELEEENKIYILNGDNVKLELYIKENYIPVQKVKDKMKKLNEEIKNSEEIEAIFKIKQQQILQELLEDK